MRRIAKGWGILLITLVIFVCGVFPLQATHNNYQLDNINFYRVESIYYIENRSAKIAHDISLDIILVNPYLTKTMPYSTLLGTAYAPEPAEISMDRKGNQTGRFTIAKLQPNETKKISIIQDYKVALINYEIMPENISICKLENETLAPYLASSPWIETDNPLIRAKAKEIIGNETNLYYKAEKIFSFLYQHLTYDSLERENPEKNKGALWALQTGKGVCEDYADLMVALLRASGIPARTVAGWVGEVEGSKVIANRNGEILPGHMWLEYYLPGYGWIPADPTYTYLVNGESAIDYSRLTALKELRFAEISESEEHTVSYSFYGEDVQVTYEVIVTNITEDALTYSNGLDPIVLYLEEVPLIFDVNPMIENGRTLVPMRGIFQALGAEVVWEGTTQKVLATTGQRQVELQIGSQKARVNNEDKVLDVAPTIVNDRTMIPLRFVGESLGCQVQWDGEKRSINLHFSK